MLTLLLFYPKIRSLLLQINTKFVKPNIKDKHTYITPTEKTPTPKKETQHTRIENAICNPFLQWL